MPNKQTATKISDGWHVYYLYRGYKIEHADDREFGGDDGWNVFAPNTESSDDRFGTLRDCKLWIDHWITTNNNNNTEG